MTRPVIAVVGGGQLARMMAPAATALGITLRVLVESPHASAAGPAHEVVVGQPTDASAVQQLCAEPVPMAVTWEHEHIPQEFFEIARQHGIPALPGFAALVHAQDKIAMRRKMDALGLPNPAWSVVDTAADVDAFIATHGREVVAKTSRGGYDGKGVRVIQGSSDITDWLEAFADGGPQVLLEQKINFDRELSQLVARRPSGEVRSWPLVESLQREGVCAEVIAPAPRTDPAVSVQARGIGEHIARELGVVGVLAVEMFDIQGELVINELAMRPHNSGHWTIDGSLTSQFEQHLRAVADLPLGATEALAPAIAMVNILGGENTDLHASLAAVEDTGAKIHLYDKEVRKGRKVGHVNVLAGDSESGRERARQVATLIREGGHA